MTPATSLTLSVRIERWPISGSFTIARGAKTEAIVVVAAVSDGVHTGRGECVPYPRYNETPEATQDALLAMAGALARGIDQQSLQAGRIAVLIVRARSNRIQDLLPVIPECLNALESIKPRQVVRVGTLHLR